MEAVAAAADTDAADAADAADAVEPLHDSVADIECGALPGSSTEHAACWEPFVVQFVESGACFYFVSQLHFLAAHFLVVSTSDKLQMFWLVVACRSVPQVQLVLHSA